MDYFINKYKEICKQEFKGWDFKSYKNNHYRVINDVFQSFNLHRSVYGNSATIEFAVIPLSYTYPIDKTRCEPTSVKCFEQSVEWFPYEKKSLQSMDVCITEMFIYVKKYLMPYFSELDSCQKLYKQLLDNELPDFLDDVSKMLVSLKNDDYVKAEEYGKLILEQTQQAYEHNLKVYAGEISPAYIEKMTAKIEEENLQLSYIRKKEDTIIKSWITDNEQCNLKRLNWKIK